MKNGQIIQAIPRVGRKKMSFNPDDPLEPVILVDVMAVYNEWGEIDRAFRGEDMRVPSEHLTAWYQANLDFVRGLFTKAIEAGKSMTPEKAQAYIAALSLGDALAFNALIANEAAALQPFFALRSPADSSSPEKQELIFSTEE